MSQNKLVGIENMSKFELVFILRLTYKAVYTVINEKSSYTDTPF